MRVARLSGWPGICANWEMSVFNHTAVINVPCGGNEAVSTIARDAALACSGDNPFDYRNSGTELRSPALKTRAHCGVKLRCAYGQPTSSGVRY